MGNNPVNFNDPTGHKACGDGEARKCNGNLSNPRPIDFDDYCNNKTTKRCDGKSVEDDVMQQVEAATEDKPNICESQKIPQVSQNTCGAVITEPSYPWMTNSPAPDDYTGHGYGGGQTVVINGQAVNPSNSAGSSKIDLSMIFLSNLVFNTNFIQQGTHSSAQGIIPFITSNSTGNTSVYGVGVYNNTFWDVVINGIEINGTRHRVAFSDNITKDNLVIAPIDWQRTIDQNQVTINYSIYSAGSYVGLGSVSYQGPIGP